MHVDAIASVACDTYLHSADALYRVARVIGTRVLLEDCRTTQIIDVPASYLDQLSPVRRRGLTAT